MECQKTHQILEITRDLTPTVSLESLLHKIVRAAVDLTQTQTAGILLHDEDTGELRFKVVSLYEDRLLNIPVPVANSIAGAAFTSGAPVIVPDVSADSRYYAEVEKLTGLLARSLLAVPLQYKEHRIGVLEVENKCDNTGFDEHDVICLTTLAAQAAIAIENAQLVTSLEARIAERQAALDVALAQSQALAALYQASAALNSTLDYETVLDRILEQIGAVIRYDAANVMLVEGDMARVFRGRGYELFGTADTLTHTSFDISATPGLATMRQTLRPLVIPNVLADSSWIYSRPEHRWIKSYVGVPIHLRGRLLGYVSVLSAMPNFYTEDAAACLESLAQQAAVAIDNAYLYQRAQQELAERERAERELQRHRDHLEELVVARTAALQQANAQLEQEIIEREQLITDLRAFSHTVAHDLKNPLTIMLGYSTLLVENLGADETPELQAARLLLNTSNKMGHIIDELLLFANVRQVEVENTLLDMDIIINEVRQRLSPALTQAGAELLLPPTWPPALGHPAWIEEVWLNYISNALKYGGRPAEGLPPRVELGYTILESGGGTKLGVTSNQQLASSIKFWVRDDGPGLTPEAQARLFTPFTRLDPRRAEGHGLGLAIVKRMVEKMGGAVGVESVVGQGARFFFTLAAVPATGVVSSMQQLLDALAVHLAAVCTAEMLEAMLQACASGDWVALQQFITRLDPQDTTVDQALLQLLHDFDYVALKNVLQTARTYQA